MGATGWRVIRRKGCGLGWGGTIRGRGAAAPQGIPCQHQLASAAAATTTTAETATLEKITEATAETAATVTAAVTVAVATAASRINACRRGDASPTGQHSLPPPRGGEGRMIRRQRQGPDADSSLRCGLGGAARR